MQTDLLHEIPWIISKIHSLIYLPPKNFAEQIGLWNNLFPGFNGFNRKFRLSRLDATLEKFLFVFHEENQIAKIFGALIGKIIISNNNGALIFGALIISKIQLKLQKFLLSDSLREKKTEIFRVS